jgi:uncharacterized membrane protein (Fun14 family)
MSATKIIGIVLLVVGLVVLVLGAYNLITYNNSTGGRIANSVAGFFGGRTEVVRNSIIQIAVGAVCAVVGFVLYRKR